MAEVPTLDNIEHWLALADRAHKEQGAQRQYAAKQRLHAERTRGTAPTRANAERLPPTREEVAFWNSVDKMAPSRPEARAAPSNLESVARAGLGGAASFGGWTSPEGDEPRAEYLARLAGTFVGDPLNALGVGKVAKYAIKALPAGLVGGLGYALSREPEGSVLDRVPDEEWDEDTQVFAGGGIVKRGALSLLRGQGALPRAEEGMTYARSAMPTSVVKPKGGNWLTGSVEDALRGLKTGETDPARIAELQRHFNDPKLGSTNLAINSWIEGPLTKYTKNRMASPDDEVRRLAEEGVLHFTPQASTGELWPGRTITSKQTFGLEPDWEQVADESIGSFTAGELQHPSNALMARGSESWLTKLPEDASVYHAQGGIDDLGFPHLIDELSNALNPESGLPRQFLLTPDAVKNMSMEKAVRRVADINAWRAAQKIEANRVLAEQASMLREYPHSDAMPNPKGLRWVELKKGEDIPANFETGDIAEKRLADQLKYEGDTMGHCVGGYCDDVLSGRSRIFSLRDAKGEPHVTVEVAPDKVPNAMDTYMEENKIPLAMGSEINAQVRSIEKSPEYAAWLKSREGKFSISQIKGKGNKKPNDEYLPFVQDFVRNSPLGGPWGDVGDLGNTGLRRTIDAFNSNELKKIQEAGIEVPQWATPEDIQKIGDTVWPGQYGKAPGFAQGGSVNSVHPYFA